MRTVVVALFLLTFVVQPFLIPSESMEHTLLVGDFLLVNKQVFAPANAIAEHLLPYRQVQRGDIVVFHYPRDPSKSFIKRVIGVAGDRIRIDFGRVYVNDVPLDEDYLAPVYEDQRSLAAIVVPPDSYFVLGDHRSMSNDSRDFGPVPAGSIYGKAVFGYWPADKMGRVR